MVENGRWEKSLDGFVYIMGDVQYYTMDLVVYIGRHEHASSRLYDSKKE